MVLQRVGHNWNNWAQYSHIPYFCQSLLLKSPIKTQVITISRLTWERYLPPFSSSSTLWSYGMIITFSLKRTWLPGALSCSPVILLKATLLGCNVPWLCCGPVTSCLMVYGSSTPWYNSSEAEVRGAGCWLEGYREGLPPPSSKKKKIVIVH